MARTSSSAGSAGLDERHEARVGSVHHRLYHHIRSVGNDRSVGAEVSRGVSTVASADVDIDCNSSVARVGRPAARGHTRRQIRWSHRLRSLAALLFLAGVWREPHELLFVTGRLGIPDRLRGHEFLSRCGVYFEVVSGRATGHRTGDLRHGQYWSVDCRNRHPRIGRLYRKLAHPFLGVRHVGGDLRNFVSAVRSQPASQD